MPPSDASLDAVTPPAIDPPSPSPEPATATGSAESEMTRLHNALGRLESKIDEHGRRVDDLAAQHRKSQEPPTEPDIVPVPTAPEPEPATAAPAQVAERKRHYGRWRS